MKKYLLARLIYLCIILLLPFMLWSCSNDTDNLQTSEALEEHDTDISSPSTSTNEGENFMSITIEVEPNHIHHTEIPKFVMVTIRNLSKKLEYRGSYHYAIEYYNGTDWVNIVSPAAIEEELVIEPSGVFELNYIQLMPDTYHYTIGKYRVTYDKWYGEFAIY
ncbi:MAG: hypothetical protein LBQ15_09730 [Clostridium sp.]|nr:hypothetical protein [Clostridium sp.]